MIPPWVYKLCSGWSWNYYKHYLCYLYH